MDLLQWHGLCISQCQFHYTYVITPLPGMSNYLSIKCGLCQLLYTDQQLREIHRAHLVRG